MPISSPLKVRSLLSAYAAKRLTPTEVVASALARIAEIDRPEVWILRVPAADLEARAHALEALYEAQGSAVFERMPLFGVPFAVKDNIDVAGLPTTAACEPFSYTPDTSAFAVQRLIDAGAILIGKTNLDQFATGLVGTRSPYGAVRNTEFPERVSGGSSSGSAVAVAAGCVAFSLGTDTAGSGRVPAGFNGLVGLKPSLGLVSKRGVVPACRSLDTISVFAHDVDDAWCVFNEIACFDPLDGYSRKVPGLGLLRGAPRIGVPDHLEFYGDAAANQAFSAALDTLSTHLHLAPTPIDFQPLKQVSALLYDGPWVAERRAALGSFFETRHEAVHPVVATVIGKADRYSAADAFNGQYALADLKRHAEQLFETIDILIVPTTPTHPLITDVQANPVELNSQLGYYTNFVNLLDLCALAVPCQRRHDGLPAGVTLIAPSGADRRLAELGARIQGLFATEAADVAGTVTEKKPAAAANTIAPLPFQEPTVALAVVGAHLRGQPLNWQLQEAGARFVTATQTATGYTLYALANTQPPKPGLVRVTDQQGAPIAVEVWDMPLRSFGKFVADVPAPLGIGSVQLANGLTVKGFICEPSAVSNGSGALDITSFGGWLAYLDSLNVN
ncbi:MULTISPECIES: allophanate hydrolase [Paraburkholderia]|uniref:allophanate hydrolase n=1 Tax=Paraburkholderia TaxID=1822464 RepID=UPI001B0C529D|nr:MULTISPECIES: allophanate hydrolase [Paraburkholderia]MCX4156942.1 allophanate hydrolase [Paraburkholderia aspalathi]MDN7166347.1 allophanate hydrolase [Paraburkholderia sp. SECH2]MDQ6394833.1 allophanate hydrolase [Paraburkholderia aspalathi]CAE6745922.1 Allophanate hydrolase [Paraburkholderia aspalathi]